MQTFYAILAILVLSIGMPVSILIVVDRIRYPQRKLSQEQREAERKRRSERFRQPNFEEVEKTCGGAVPKRLKLAYEQSDLVLARNVDFTPPGKDPEKHRYWIQDFVPMDAEGQSHTTDLSDFGSGCCFAGDGCGNFYWTPVSDLQQDDAPVYFACHDPYGNEKVADSLEEFFSWLEAQAETPNS